MGGLTLGILSEADRTAMREATREAAFALADDLSHIRKVVGTMDPVIGDIRRVSNQLRRILVEGDLRRVAGPRMGKINIVAPDIRAFHRRNELKPYVFLFADKVRAFGLESSMMSVERGKGPPEMPQGYDPAATATLRVEPFTNQKVICFEGEWVTRADVIKYVANVAHGVHTTDAKERAHFLIRKIRYAWSGSVVDDIPSFGFDISVVGSEDPTLQSDRANLDLALLSLIATGQHLTGSPEILALEKEIERNG